jgi:LemA protein
MDELAGTENRIVTARNDYNTAVKDYNTKITTIPSSIVAGMMGREKKDFFEVSDESKLKVPEVNFDTDKKE